MRAQSDGKTINSPTSTMTVPEKILQNIDGISIRSVEAFKSKVNMMTENESEPITTSARLDIRFPSVSEDPTTTGNKGRIHGASTVSIPANIAIKKKIIVI